MQRGLSVAPDDPFLNLVAAKCERRRGDYDEAERRVTRNHSLRHQATNGRRRFITSSPGFEDRAGAYSQSMAAASKANQLALGDWRGGAAADNPYNRMLAQLSAAVEGSWIEDWSPLGEQGAGPAPVFLVGFPRSGTTLLDTIIGSHPDFRGARGASPPSRPCG